MKIRERLAQQYDGYVARRVAMDVLAMTKEGLVMRSDEVLMKSDESVMDGMMERCQSGEPLAYVLGYEMFCGEKFVVDERVLIPRSETEELVVLVVESGKLKAKNSLLIDMGTGSGCVGLSIMKRLKKVEEGGRRLKKVVLCDVSEGALEVARKNADTLGVDAITKQVDIMRLVDDNQGLDEVLEEADNVVIVANLPYIPDDYEGVEDDVQEREPHLALYSGADGLDHYRALIGWIQKIQEMQGIKECMLWMEMMTDQVPWLESEFGEMVAHQTLHPNIVMVEMSCKQ